MIAIWRFLGIPLIVQTTLLAIKEGIYYKSFLPLRILNVQYLQENICFELKTGEKIETFYLSTDRQAKVKMTLKLLLETLN